MKAIITRIFVYAFIVVIVFTIFLKLPGYKTEISPLGTVLSAYFYNMNAKTTEDIASIYAPHIHKVTNPELKKFYRKFDWTPKKVAIDFSSEIETTWQQYNIFGGSKENYLQYWQTMRPIMQQFYKKNIAAVDISDPVIHVRCSDAPFVLHPQYHLTKSASVRWMAEQVKARGYTKVVMLTCNKHNKEKNNPCADFFRFYEHIFVSEGLAVEKQCNSVYKDFALMFYSPLLVSLNASGYSFMAGIAKEPQNFISCNFGRERHGKYMLQTEADWSLDPREPLLHKDVAAYYNVQEVLAKLAN